MSIRHVYDIVIYFNPKIYNSQRMHFVLDAYARSLGGSFTKETKRTLTYSIPSLKKVSTFRFVVRRIFNLSLSEIEIKGPYSY